MNYKHLLQHGSKAMCIVLALAFTTGCDDEKAKKETTDTASIATVVETDKGPVAGEKTGEVVRFLGIPYAQSIEGRNRFAPPQPMEAWTTVRKATTYAESSPQQGADPTGGSPVTPAFAPPAYVKSGDDCLALNIWTPEKADGSLPVMVWLHGGGWTTGSGSCGIYDGENLASRGDVIVVTINHRLGASGFTDFSRVLGGDFANSSNLGMKDIVAALTWVQTNIKNFGGNPELVTIFGESGGGWKVNTMLGIPSAKGLFQRAIVESGPLTRFLSTEAADELANGMLEALGIDKAHPEQLYEVSHEAMEKAEADVMKKVPMSFSSPGFPTGFWPVLDGSFIPAHVYDPAAVASSLDVPLLLGQTGTEFSLFMLGDTAAYALDKAGLSQRVKGTFGAEVGTTVLATYEESFPDYEPSALWFRIFSDFAMGTLSSEILDQRSVAGAAPVYAYRFDWMTPIADGKLFSPHTMEIPFVFNNITNKPGTTMTGGSDEAVALANTISEAWVQFAKTGTPAAAGLPEWPAYTTATRNSMHLNTTSTVAPYMDADMVALFHKMLWARAGLTK